jgi:hypothetical protein
MVPEPEFHLTIKPSNNLAKECPLVDESHTHLNKLSYVILDVRIIFALDHEKNNSIVYNPGLFRFHMWSDGDLPLLYGPL